LSVGVCSLLPVFCEASRAELGEHQCRDLL